MIQAGYCYAASLTGVDVDNMKRTGGIKWHCLVLSRTAKNAMCLYVLAKIGSSSSIRYNLSDYSLSYKQHIAWGCKS